MGLPVADICFYHNAPDPLRVACVLTAKAVSSGHRVSVLIPDGRRAQQFDYLLWSFQPLAFIPHVGAQSPLAAETPVVIATDARALPHQDVLINLGDQVPAGYERYNRVLEVVAPDELGRQAARNRFRQYKSLGLSPSAHDLAQRNSHD